MARPTMWNIEAIGALMCGDVMCFEKLEDQMKLTEFEQILELGLKQQRKQLDEILEYIKPYHKYMWAARIWGIIKERDFKDAPVEIGNDDRMRDSDE